MPNSKPLGHDDESGFAFVKELLQGEPTCAINFDRLQLHPEKGYIIFEFLLCDQKQAKVTPHTSHPSKYWHKNRQKFISLYRVAKDLKATLYLVNYSKPGTPNEDKIKVIRVDELSSKGIAKETVWETSRGAFAWWFRKINRECCQ
ncbi:hypothetical protein H9Q13_06925 [Pontibacter sp. JH31]|uniref:Uncharacterized protein n=1 Tax=Pontibacter aquaedesilientis TaxID=2766980 RepID=A0ABR7XF19_9BACT|nr:hypothetical protein [Pontibacter aquaedesilientis]MBD1396892.1 hypothetical protein [Pontibacter aquaedesilientis]